MVRRELWFPPSGWSFQTMCVGVNTSPCPLVYEVAAQSVPGPSIWTGLGSQQAGKRLWLLCCLLTQLVWGFTHLAATWETRDLLLFIIHCQNHPDWTDMKRQDFFSYNSIRSHFNCTDHFLKRRNEFCHANLKQITARPIISMQYIRKHCHILIGALAFYGKHISTITNCSFYYRVAWTSLKSSRI